MFAGVCTACAGTIMRQVDCAAQGQMSQWAVDFFAGKKGQFPAVKNLGFRFRGGVGTRPTLFATNAKRVGHPRLRGTRRSGGPPALFSQRHPIPSGRCAGRQSNEWLRQRCLGISGKSIARPAVMFGPNFVIVEELQHEKTVAPSTAGCAG